MAKRMRTSRSALDRLLYPDNAGGTLATMGCAAAAFGKRLRMNRSARCASRKPRMISYCSNSKRARGYFIEDYPDCIASESVAGKTFTRYRFANDQ